jgi:phenylacetate-coenzyme A ligase PaaK-like adenylate-forming protein
MTATQLKQIQDVAGALLRSFQLGRHDGWTPARLRQHQLLRLNALVRHAVEQSPFYRQYYRGLPLHQQIDLRSLPTVDKRTVMENFDYIVTDRRLTRTALEDETALSGSGSHFLGQYRVLSTTGTSGVRGIFVYDRHAWQIVLANTIRWHRFAGLRPRLPRRLRICSIGADVAAHISRSIPESGDVGLFKLLTLSATQPLPDLVAALNRFRPDVLMPYPSIAALLAEQQLSGRLAIQPHAVLTHSEALSGEMRRRIAKAWRASVFDHYGLTEEPHVACECREHAGLHIFEDLSIVEVVDADGAPVPSGTLGSRYLLTNLYNRVQPLIRYEVTDLIATTDEPCACGRPFARIVKIGGRKEQMLLLRDSAGRQVAVPPLTLSSCLDVMPELVEYQLRHSGARIEVLAVPRQGVDRHALGARIARQLGDIVRGLGAEPPEIVVVLPTALEQSRDRMGKLQQVHVTQPPAAGALRNR